MKFTMQCDNSTNDVANQHQIKAPKRFLVMFVYIFRSVERVGGKWELHGFEQWRSVAPAPAQREQHQSDHKLPAPLDEAGRSEGPFLCYRRGRELQARKGQNYRFVTWIKYKISCFLTVSSTVSSI